MHIFFVGRFYFYFWARSDQVTEIFFIQNKLANIQHKKKVKSKNDKHENERTKKKQQKKLWFLRMMLYRLEYIEYRKMKGTFDAINKRSLSL